MKKLLLVLGALATLSGQAWGAGQTLSGLPPGDYPAERMKDPHPAYYIAHVFYDKDGVLTEDLEYVPPTPGSEFDPYAPGRVHVDPKPRDIPINQRLHKYYEDDTHIYFWDSAAGNATVGWDKKEHNWTH